VIRFADPKVVPIPAMTCQTDWTGLADEVQPTAGQQKYEVGFVIGGLRRHDQQKPKRAVCTCL